MKKISKEAEDRLVSAVEKTAMLVNDGMSPNEAIAKAAAEDGVPPGHINLMVHAYNTGRTTRQRQSGGDTFEKVADFELADAATVLEQIYPNQVKTAAAAFHSTIVSTEYAIPPTGVLERRATRQIQKQAQNVDWTKWSLGYDFDDDGNPIERIAQATAPPPLAHEPTYLMKKAYCDAERKQREINEASRKVASAKDRLATTFMELTEHFKSASSQPIPVVREQCSLIHGGKATELIDEIVKVTPSLMKLSKHKKAQYDENRMYSADGDAYALVSQFLDELDELKRLKQAYDATHHSNMEAMEELLAPFVVAPASVLDDHVFLTSEERVEKRAGGMMNMLIGGSLASKALKNVGEGFKGPSDKEVDRTLGTLTDPAHEGELRRIRSSAALQDMMLNDPIISTQPPDDVLNAYNEIVELAPRAGDQRIILQALMRKRLEQGSLDPFEVDQLLGMEQKQKKIQEPGGGDASVLS